MLNVIRSDLYRIFHKKTNYIFLLTLILIYTLILSTATFTNANSIDRFSPDFSLALLDGCVGIADVVLAIHALITVYCNDLSSGKINHILANVYPQGKYIFAKFLTLCMYLFFLYLILDITFWLELAVFSKGFLGDFSLYIPLLHASFSLGFAAYLATIIYALLGASILFLSKNIPLTLIASLLYSVSFFSNILSLLAKTMHWLSHLQVFCFDTIVFDTMTGHLSMNIFYLSFLAYLLVLFLFQFTLLEKKELA